MNKQHSDIKSKFQFKQIKSWTGPKAIENMGKVAKVCVLLFVNITGEKR